MPHFAQKMQKVIMNAKIACVLQNSEVFKKYLFSHASLITTINNTAVPGLHISIEGLFSQIHDEMAMPTGSWNVPLHCLPNKRADISS